VASSAAAMRTVESAAAQRHALLFAPAAHTSGISECGGVDGNEDRCHGDAAHAITAHMHVAESSGAGARESTDLFGGGGGGHQLDVPIFSEMEWLDADGGSVVRLAQELTSQVATLMQLLQLASDARNSAQARARELEQRHREAVAASDMAQELLADGDETMRLQLQTSMASEAEVKSLKKQLIAVESRASDRLSLAGASAERKVGALLEEKQAEFARKEVALQKTIRELQRGIESKKALTALAQQKKKDEEARAAAAEARLSSVGDKTQRLEAAEAFAKRDVAEARRARDEQRTQVVLLQQQLADAEAERAKAEGRAAQARKAAHSKSREAQDLRSQVAKWESALSFAQQLHKEAVEEANLLRQELTARADGGGLDEAVCHEVLVSEEQVTDVLHILQELLGRVELVVNRRGELEVELSLAQQRLINEREHSQDLAAAMAQSPVEHDRKQHLLQSTLDVKLRSDRQRLAAGDAAASGGGRETALGARECLVAQRFQAWTEREEAAEAQRESDKVKMESLAGQSEELRASADSAFQQAAAAVQQATEVLEQLVATRVQHAFELSATALRVESVCVSSETLLEILSALSLAVCSTRAERTYHQQEWQRACGARGLQEQLQEAQVRELREKVAVLGVTIISEAAGAVEELSSLGVLCAEALQQGAVLVTQLRSQIQEVEHSKNEAELKVTVQRRKAAEIMEQLRQDLLTAKRLHTVAPSPLPPTRMHMRGRGGRDQGRGSSASSSTPSPSRRPRQMQRNGTGNSDRRSTSASGGSSSSSQERVKRGERALARRGRGTLASGRVDKQPNARDNGTRSINSRALSHQRPSQQAVVASYPNASRCTLHDGKKHGGSNGGGDGERDVLLERLRESRLLLVENEELLESECVSVIGFVLAPLLGCLDANECVYNTCMYTLLADTPAHTCIDTLT